MAASRWAWTESARFHRPNRVAATWPIALLRDFSPAPGSPAAPTLVIPPRSGHASCLVDLSERGSLLGAALDAGLTNLHCVDWLVPSDPRTDAGIEAHLQVLREAVTALGGRVNLVGFSQGAWLATLFAARWPDAALTLTVAGAPIDCHHGLGRALLPATLIQRAGQLGAEGAWLNTSEPALRNWLHQPQPVPLALSQWLLDHLVIRNELARGTGHIAGGRADLAAIDCPLFLIAGLRDPVAPPEQVWRLAALASTPDQHVVKAAIDCGHMAMITDESTLRNHWQPIFRNVRVASAALG